jgi:hypothetical protein
MIPYNSYQLHQIERPKSTAEIWYADVPGRPVRRDHREPAARSGPARASDPQAAARCQRILHRNPMRKLFRYGRDVSGSTPNWRTQAPKLSTSSSRRRLTGLPLAYPYGSMV